jgi:hypothetical protein
MRRVDAYPNRQSPAPCDGKRWPKRPEASARGRLAHGVAHRADAVQPQVLQRDGGLATGFARTGIASHAAALALVPRAAWDNPPDIAARNRPMMPLLFWSLLLVSFLIAVVVLFSHVRRIGRRRRAELLSENDPATLRKVAQALKAGDYRSASRRYFPALLADGWTRVMKALRVFLVGIVLLILVLFGYGIFSAL